MTDHELAALTALVNVHATEVEAANNVRISHGQAMAYDGCYCPEIQVLAEELKRRGILQQTDQGAP